MEFDPMRWLSLPPGLELKESSAEYKVLGVWSTQSFDKDVELGPYEGEIIAVSEDNDVDYRYAWEIIEGSDVVHVVNATDPKDGNWMRYVQNARCRDEQNLVSFQKDGQIYYRTIKPITQGEELLVYLNVSQKVKNRIVRQRKLLAQARAAARTKARQEEEQRESEAQESEEDEDEEEPMASRKRALSDVTEDDSNSALTSRSEPAKRYKMEGKGSRESRVVQEVCAAATQMTKGDMTLSNIKVYSCEPGQEYVFDMTQDYKGIGRTGRPCHRCYVCESAQPSKESLRKHFIASHISYRYLSRQDQDRYQVVAEKQELRIEARKSLKVKDQPAPKSEATAKKCSRPGLYRCHLCYDLFDEESELLKHVKDKEACPERRTRSQPLGCQSCPETFSSLRMLLTHMSQQHSDNESSFRRCDWCDTIFATASEVKRHRCSENLRCSPCQKLFKSVEDLHKHRVEVHPETVSSEESAPVADSGMMGQHGKKVLCSFRCGVCRKRFTSSMSLDLHRATDHEQDPYSLNALILKKTKVRSGTRADDVFFNNVSLNIATNLSQYIDGKVESLAKAGQYILIPDYKKVSERPSPQIDWQKHNYPPYFQPYESVHPVASCPSEGQAACKGTTAQDLLEMSSALEGAGDMRLTRSSLSQISRQARSLSRQKSSESKGNEDSQDASPSVVESVTLQDGSETEAELAERPVAGNGESTAATCQNGAEPMDTAAVVTSEQVEEDMEVEESEKAEESAFKVPSVHLNGLIDNHARTGQQGVAEGEEAWLKEPLESSETSSGVCTVQLTKTSSSEEEADTPSASFSGRAENPGNVGTAPSREPIDAQDGPELTVADSNDDSGVFGELTEESNRESCGCSDPCIKRLDSACPSEAQSCSEDKGDESTIPGDGDSGVVLEESEKSAAAEIDSDSNQNSPPPPVLCAIGDHQSAKGLDGSEEIGGNGDSSGNGTDSPPPPLSPVMEARTLPEFFGKNSQDENKNDLMNPSEFASVVEEGASSSVTVNQEASDTACAALPEGSSSHLCSVEEGMSTSTSKSDLPVDESASSSKCLDQPAKPCTPASDTKASPPGTPTSPDRFPRALSLSRRKEGQETKEMAIPPSQNTMDDYIDRPLSPKTLLEKYAFGKCGRILFVCSVCKKQYYDQESCERHQLKWHPTILCSILAVEGGNGIEDLFFIRPSNIGILASNTPIPEDVHNLPFYTCTRCGMTCKSIHRLHYHIFMCDPSRPEEEKSRKKKKKKKRSVSEAGLESTTEETAPPSTVPPPKKQKNSIATTTMQKAQASIKRAKTRIRQKKKKFPIEEPAVDPLRAKRRRSKNYELQYNPQRHRRRREMTELLENHLCRGCETTFKSLSLLERHARKCTGKDRLQNQKPVLSSVVGDPSKGQLPCRYCSKKFSYLKTLANHYRKFCTVRKEKKKHGDMSEEDNKDEQVLFGKIRQMEQAKTTGSSNENSGKKGKGGWPKGLKRRGRRKHQLWTSIKRRTRSSDAAGSDPVVLIVPDDVSKAEQVASQSKVAQGKKSKNSSKASISSKMAKGKSPGKNGGSNSATKPSGSSKTSVTKSKSKAKTESASAEKTKKTATPKSKSPDESKDAKEKSRATPGKTKKSEKKPVTLYYIAKPGLTSKKSSKAVQNEWSGDYKVAKAESSLLKQALESQVIAAASGHSSKNSTASKTSTVSKNGPTSKISTASKNTTVGKNGGSSKTPTASKNSTGNKTSSSAKGQEKSSPSKGSTAKAANGGTAASAVKKSTAATGKAAGKKQRPSSKGGKLAVATTAKKPSQETLSLDGLQKNAQVIMVSKEVTPKKIKVPKLQPGKPVKLPVELVQGSSVAGQQEEAAMLAARAPNLYNCLTEGGKTAADCSPSGSEASR